MHFLIVKTSSLGDILHTFPVVSYLHQKFPMAKIDWVVEASCAELLTTHPLINRVITIDTKKWRKNISWKEIFQFRKEIQKTNYEAAFDLQGNVKSGCILMLAKAKEKIGFGVKTVSEWPNLFFTSIKKNPPNGLNIREDYLFVVQNYFGDALSPIDEAIILGQTPHELLNTLPRSNYKVMVCPGAFWPNKQLSKETLFSFLKPLQERKKAHFFFAWGTEKEREFSQELVKKLQGTLLPRLKLPVLQNVMGHMDLVITMDSLPLHLAATTKTPTLSFFGPSLAKKYAPVGPQHHVIQGKCPYNIIFSKRCPKLRTCRTGACLKEIEL